MTRDVEDTLTEVFGLPFCHDEDLDPRVAALPEDELVATLTAVTAGAWLPVTADSLPEFFVVVWHSGRRRYRVMPGGFSSYAQAQERSADLNRRAEGLLSRSRAYDRVLGYRPPYVRFLPMTAGSWRGAVGSDGERVV